jgi:hypothetical protein
MEWKMQVSIDEQASVLTPREVWRLTRPVVWLVPVLYVAATVTERIGFRLGNPDRPLFDFWLALGTAEQFLPFVGLALMGLVMVAVGRRRLWIVPVLVFQLAEAMRDLSAVLVGGAPWRMLLDDLLTVSGPLGRFGRLGGPLLIALVSAPALLLLYRHRTRSRRKLPTPTDIAGMGTTLLLIGIVTYLAGVFAPSDTQILLLLVELGPLVIFGLAVGMTKGWWPWAPAAAGLLMLGGFGWLSIESAPRLGLSAMFWPRLSAALIASLWLVFARWIDTSTRHPAATLVVLNVLNVADALFTRFAVAAGVATELNPLVDGAGMILKVLLVAAAGFVIYRVRPRLLIWPTLALVAVTLWHLVGMVVNA